MRALRISRPGHPLEVLELVDLPEPEPGPGEVLLDVLAAPISPMDRLAIRGLYPLPPLQGLPGAQGVGRVLALGEGVADWVPGDLALLPVRAGSWRERLTAPTSELLPLPADIDPVERCTLRIEGFSASVLLDAVAPGEWFVHSPGGGAVGRYLTAVGRARDLHSIALVGSRDPIADLWGLGADHVLLREPTLPARLSELGLPAPQIGFDGSGGRVSELLAACLEVGGRLLVYGAATRSSLQLGAGVVVFRQLRLEGFWLHAWARDADQAEQHRRLDELLRVNLGEHVVGRFGLDDWREALRLAETPNLRGRVVLTPTWEA